MPVSVLPAELVLKPSDPEAIVARIDLGCTYAEIARMLRKSSTNAARMAVERAIVRLVQEMQRQRGPGS